MKIGILIPNRGDREELLSNCIRMMKAQTIADQIEWMLPVSFKPTEGIVDITTRYRIGYDILSKFGVDIIFFIENDDWYSPEYLETMIREWEYYSRPELFGTNYTIYYNLKLQKHFTMFTEQRASAMNTMIKPGLFVSWPLEQDPYTDVWLWEHIQNRRIFKPKKVISVGMKHGIGLCGGYAHTTKLHRYIYDDDGFLKETLDTESYKFYKSISERLQQAP